MAALLCLAAAPPALAGPPALTFDGLPPVRIGMTVPQAESALHARLAPMPDFESAECWMTRRADGLDPGVAYMVEQGRITRIDVWRPQAGARPAVRTAAGIGIGSAEAEIAAAYGQGAVQPDPYLGDRGHRVTVEGETGGRALVFETVDGLVVGFRAGRHPAVDYSEGCQ
jgi:hypothetical protein